MIAQAKIDSLSELIREVGRKMREIHREIPGMPLKPMALLFLKFVAEKKNPTMKELADQFSITPPSVTGLIDSLVAERYLLRDFDRDDRRLIRLSITEKGRQTLKKCLQLARKGMAAILGQMDEAEIDNLYSGLNHLLKIIKINKYGKN
ncbi:MAG TPA: MarR family transcriptional regulator [Candidatus Nanoarchaeia archaeon]|nr:MarR family transcriptional regulator [Candidatus Nanoarchaeia archaeon]